MLTAFIVAGRADSLVGDVNGMGEFAVPTGMPNANRPGHSLGIMTCQIEIPACINREVSKRLEFPRGCVDSQTLYHRPQVQNEWAGNRDRSVTCIQMNIPITSPRVGCAKRPHGSTRSILAIKPS